MAALKSRDATTTARNPYAAEVFHLHKDGRFKKLARVFFVKHKSLVFYGYDLGQPSEFRNASAFQVRANREHNRRWMSKLGNPEALNQIRRNFHYARTKRRKRQAYRQVHRVCVSAGSRQIILSFRISECGAKSKCRLRLRAIALQRTARGGQWFYLDEGAFEKVTRRVADWGHRAQPGICRRLRYPMRTLSPEYQASLGATDFFGSGSFLLG